MYSTVQMKKAGLQSRLWLSIIIIGVILLAIGLLIANPGKKTKLKKDNNQISLNKESQNAILLKDSNSQADTIQITAVGDIMFGSNFPTSATLPPDDGKSFMQEYTQDFKSGDIIFGNLEGVFMDSGGKPKGRGNNIYCFRQPVRYAEIYKNFGFNLLSIANNHMADFGSLGVESTSKTLDALGIPYAGSVAKPFTILTIKNKKIGFAAFSPHNGTANMNDYPAAKAVVQQLKKEVDIVIVSFHGGGEGEKYQHVTRQRELFYSQNRGNVYEFAHTMIDAGADVVLGHGPHVLRGVESYKNKFIAYSLGNFCTYGQFSLKGPNALAALLKININTNGDLLHTEVISGIQVGKGGPIKDPGNQAFLKLKELSNQDFPESPLVFSGNSIRYKKSLTQFH